MIIAILAACSVAAAPSRSDPLDVAFDARFYYRDSRRSEFHLYVCALDGSHRREVRVARHVWNLQWVDRTNLAWIEGTFYGTKRLYVAAAPYTQKRFVRAAKDISFPDSTHVRPASRIPCDIDKRPYWLAAYPPMLTRRRGAPRDAWAVPERIRQAGGKLFIDLQRKGVRRSFRWINPEFSYKVNYGAGGMDDFSPNPKWVQLEEHIRNGRAQRSWVVGHEGLTAHEGVSLVFALDWKHRTARLLPFNVEDKCIAPRRMLLAGSGGRLLSDFNGGNLWTSQLTVANLRTGKWRYIVKGLAWVGNVALRP